MWPGRARIGWFAAHDPHMENRDPQAAADYISEEVTADDDSCRTGQLLTDTIEAWDVYAAAHNFVVDADGRALFNDLLDFHLNFLCIAADRTALASYWLENWWEFEHQISDGPALESLTVMDVTGGVAAFWTAAG